MNSVILVVVNCGNTAEAKRLGEACLSNRFIACYDIIPRLATAYYWPPSTGRIERGRGTTVVLVTLPRLASKVRAIVKKLHHDSLPFIGQQSIRVEPEYGAWIRDELRAGVPSSRETL